MEVRREGGDQARRRLDEGELLEERGWATVDVLPKKGGFSAAEQGRKNEDRTATARTTSDPSSKTRAKKSQPSSLISCIRR